jgi:hypothetical protein
MKHFNLKTLIALCVASVCFVSCFPCDCCNKKVNCGANGTCLNDICLCADGYEGSVCDGSRNRKFIGYWKGTEVYHYGLNNNDTVALDLTIVQVKDSANTVKVTNQDGKIIRMNGRNPSNYYFYTDKDVVLDSLRTLTDASISMGKASDTIYYNTNYKPIGANNSFPGFGVLVKQ